MWRQSAFPMKPFNLCYEIYLTTTISSVCYIHTVNLDIGPNIHCPPWICFIRRFCAGPVRFMKILSGTKKSQRNIDNLAVINKLPYSPFSELLEKLSIDFSNFLRRSIKYE